MLYDMATKPEYEANIVAAEILLDTDGRQIPKHAHGTANLDGHTSSTRKVQLKFWVTEEERAIIERKMEMLKTKNMGAYLRKMAIDGYIIKANVDMLLRIDEDQEQRQERSPQRE